MLSMKQLDINEIKSLHDTFNECIDLNYRLVALKNLKQVVIEHESAIYEALHTDLCKSDKEAFLCEYNEVLDEISNQIRHLKQWAKTKRVRSTYQTFGTKSYLVKKPQGKVLIIVPFNYPINLSLIPLAGAIAAGNRVIVKMSKNTPHVNEVIRDILEKAFDVKHVAYASVDSYDELYEYQPHMIFFTGSTSVGKQIESYCVDHNIHYVTEMGGMCPAVVLDVKTPEIYKRIVWAKFLNAGQTCVSINYILYSPHVIDFKERLIEAINLQYPEVIKNHNLPKMINQKEFERVTKIIDKYKDKVIYGGMYDATTLTISPTVIEADVNMIKECGEIFGPVLLICCVNDTFEHYLDTIKEIDNTPLAAYLFTNDIFLQDRFVNELVAGGYCINDALIHLTNHHLPFGGEYTSGSGKYHGKYSFDSFSLINGVVKNNAKKDLSIKYINNEITYKKTKRMINLIKKFFH